MFQAWNMFQAWRVGEGKKPGPHYTYSSPSHTHKFLKEFPWNPKLLAGAPKGALKPSPGTPIRLARGMHGAKPGPSGTLRHQI